MLLTLLVPPTDGRLAAVGMLALRAFFGVGIACHGSRSLRQPRRFADQEGIPFAAAVVAVYAQFFLGMALVLGIATVPSAAALLLVMLGALASHFRKHHGFLVEPDQRGAYTKGWEPAGAYAAAFAALVLAGPGRYSLDALLAPWILDKL